jgi:diketogulonate reductase-like aldo/keto reductase
MPQLGLGVWQAKEGEEVESAVTTALECGYRLIDTATAYQNESGVGRAIKASGVPRDEIFITTKLWNGDHGYDKTLKAFELSMSKLGLDYLDLYLIHWPVPAQNKFVDSWKAFEKLYADKLVRAIGVSNFSQPHLEQLLQSTEVIPTVNQVELHPKMQQHKLRDFCAEHDIKVESWSPLMRGGEVLQDPVIIEIAKNHEATPAQVVIRWHIQSGLIVIPKSVHADRIKENFDVFKFELTDKEMRRIENMDAGKRIGPDPDTANFA